MSERLREPVRRSPGDSEGVLYTEHANLHVVPPIVSLWSYETRTRDRDRRPVTINRDGNHEFWLERSDPLLNTILPSTELSVIVNASEPWAAGRSPAMSALLPRACVVGPVTESRILHVGRRVRSIGAVVATIASRQVFGVAASELVDRIVPLEDLWGRDRVDHLSATLDRGDAARSLATLRDVLLNGHEAPPLDLVHHAAELIERRAGQVAIDRLARHYDLTRQQFSRRFSDATGISPKRFARVKRFNALVHGLLSTEVSEWASLATDIGFYDQAHMINEFRAFAGAPPTVFFQPHGLDGNPMKKSQLTGRPSEWLCPAW